MGADLYWEEKRLAERDVKEFYQIVLDLGIKCESFDRPPEELRRFLEKKGLLKSKGKRDE